MVFQIKRGCILELALRDKGTGNILVIESEKKPRGYMVKMNTGLKTAVCLAASSLLSGAASAATIYDNSTTFEGVRTAEGTVEHGDVIGFAGTERILTTVQFEYFVSPTRSSNETAVFSLYSVTGGVISGTPLYQ